jgi:hypothetical protein
MNKGFLRGWLLLIFSGICVGMAPPREGLSISLLGLASSCHQVSKSSKESVNLIEFYGWLRSASSEELARQHNCADDLAKKEVSRGKIVLALTLIVPDTPFTDYKRARTLLEEYLQDAPKDNREDRSLALLMLAPLDEIARLEEQLDQLKAIEKDITDTEQSVNVPTPTPEPTPEQNHESEETDTSGR